MNRGIGEPVPRREDRRLLTGAGCYSDDMNRADQLYGHVLRAPHAHAKLRSVDAAAARAAPGVVTVLTAREYAEDGHHGMAHGTNPADALEPRNPSFMPEHGAFVFVAPHPPIVADVVRHVGEPVAFVVAETLAQARDAAELIAVDYEALPVVAGVLDAIAPGAPRIWDGAPQNYCVRAELGDAQAAEAALSRAAHIVRASFVNNRVANCQMEPRAALAEIEPGTGRLVLWAGSQGPHRLKVMIAQALNLDTAKVRVVSRDTGGGFGPRSQLYAEFVLTCWAAQRLGRPVKWTSDRSDAFISDYQGRDLVTHAELALDADGAFTAMMVELIGNVGGNTVAFVSLSNGPRLVPSVYRIPAVHARINGVVTNTLPTSPYRGAGRPEAMFVMERMIDLAARRTGIDRVELRRRNLIRPDEMPYVSPMGPTYDCGEFAENMETTMRMAGWDGFAGRRADARSRGRLRGIGIANYIEAPVGAPMERAEIRVDGSGAVTVEVGTHSHGQGHETSFAQVVSEWLGIDYDTVTIGYGDTDRIATGGGTHSDRSMRMAGKVMVDACEEIIEKGTMAASHLLEAAAADIEFANGIFTVRGTDRAIGLFDVAAALAAGEGPEALGNSLDGTGNIWGRIPAHPNGCAACEVEIDPETGIVDLVNYCTVDDVGRAINPLIVHGQTHGGIAQGVGQALWEDARYDPASGQLLAGSFMDYGIARADVLPSFRVELNEVPTKGNKLGVKGGGEGGTTPAPAAVVNAIVDALSEFGVDHIDMPATPEKVWRAIHNFRG